MTDIIKEYDFIMPIGRCCHVASLIINNGLSIMDGPWNWSGTAYESAIFDRLKMLYKGFDHFFDRKDFVPFEPYKDQLCAFWNDKAPRILPSAPIHSDNKSPSRKELQYYNKKTKTYYIHDFFEDTNFETQFEDVKRKYKRRSERTLKYIKQANSVLLIYMSHIGEQHRNLPLNSDKVVRIMNKLRKKYPNTTIDFYMFDHNPNFKDGNFKREVLDIGIIRYISNHDDVFPPTDTNPSHTANGWMAPISVCNILSKIALTNKFRMI